MPRVDLIYDRDCPNVQAAREALLRGFNAAGLVPGWLEWDRNSPGSPGYVRHYGSPTILVEGRDVAAAQPLEDSDACRVYDHGVEGLSGVPGVQAIAFALAGVREHGRSGWGFLASLPGAGAALLPVGACPACLPAYAGILGSLGLGFVLDATYLLPVAIAFLGLALFALGFRAGSRQGYGPAILGGVAVCFILVFKFGYAFDPLVYAGIFALVIASLWNAWPKKKIEAGSCSKCVQQGPVIGTKNAS